MVSQAQSAYENGKRLRGEEKYAEAAQEFARAVRLEPSMAEYRGWHARTLANLKRYDEALAEAAEALRLGQTAVAHFAIGIVHHDQGRHEKAIQAYTSAAKADATFAPAYANRGDVYYDTKIYDLAVADYCRALELGPELTRLYFRLGYAYSESGKPDQAIENYSKAIESDPGEHWAWNNRGWEYEKLKQYDRALTDYQRAVQIAPTEATILRNLARAHERAGKLEAWASFTARRYAAGDIGEYVDDDTEIRDVCDTVHRHLLSQTLTELKSSGEHLVEYFPVTLSWGYRQTMGISDGKSYWSHSGSCGMGYACFTDAQIHLYSLGDLSRKYMKSRGLFKRALFAVFMNFDFTKVEKTDKQWGIPYRSVSIQRTDDGVGLNTSSDQWQLQPLWAHEAKMITIAQMGQRGALKNIWEPPAPVSQPSAPAPLSSVDVMKLLEQLAALKERGLVNEQEFQRKKSDLLTRL